MNSGQRKASLQHIKIADGRRQRNAPPRYDVLLRHLNPDTVPVTHFGTFAFGGWTALFLLGLAQAVRRRLPKRARLAVAPLDRPWSGCELRVTA